MGRFRLAGSGGVLVDVAACRLLEDPERLSALQLTGLGPAADPEMEFFAGWVRKALGASVALVSLVQADRQVFPGMVGLSEPWASRRSTPLTHSFCQHVVTTAEPVVITDARRHTQVEDSLAIPDLGVIAYAGMPLTDDHGNVLGSLCVIDHSPREWTDDELDTLQCVAHACSIELRLRLAGFDADRETDRRDEIEDARRLAFERSEALLRTLKAFSETSTVEDVRAAIVDVLGTELRASYVRVVVLDEHGRLRRLPAACNGSSGGLAVETADVETVAVTAALPSATAVRERRVVAYRNRDDFDRDHPAAARQAIRDRGLHSVVAVPLPGIDGPGGAVVLGWPAPDAFDPAGLLTITTIAGYAGAALERARVLHHRVSVAHELQDAMLTTLPEIAGLCLAARYAPADTRENVGGDWFDAVSVRDPGNPDAPILAVSVGDIMGHTLSAAAVMAQARSMLRQSAWDHPDAPPSLILGAFDTANRGLDLGAAGSAVLGQLRPAPGGHWMVQWTNAGHPPPILLLPDGTTELLTDHDPLFGFSFTIGHARADHRRDLAPGTTLFLYTDGLVEHQAGDADGDIDAGIDALVALLDRLRGRTPQEIVATTVEALAPNAPDDVVAFAIHVPGRAGE